MRGVAPKTVLAATLAGMALLVASQADAHDRWDKWERKHHWKQSRGYGPPVRVIVDRPLIIERPVLVETAPPMLMAPAYPTYLPYGGYPQEPSVNFNFSFPR
jgi:hypothetical protein